MKQSDPLILLHQGTLERPGPYGRLARLALGILCLYALYELFEHSPFIIESPATAMLNIVTLLVPAILIFNYVVNIGFGRSWGRWPIYVSVAGLLAIAAASWYPLGTSNHAVFGIALWSWLGYFYGHLGISFVLAAVIATPGCEMRAIPQLAVKLTGGLASEHSCPVSCVTKLDEWEQRRRRRK
jgi:hypothetical protein